MCFLIIYISNTFKSIFELKFARNNWKESELNYDN